MFQNIMWTMALPLVVVAICCRLLTTAAAASQPVVDVAGGRLVGRTVAFDEQTFLNVKTEVDIFLGIPYAEPPERFSASVAKAPWEGDWDATHYRDLCTQRPQDLTGPISASEDCLYLNIFRPHPKPDNVPVMVFIPGGAFQFGGASTPEYDGTVLAASTGVIVVTVNYRVGVFGIFTTGDSEASGNFALLDQVVALRWVQENIGAFGGDRDRVTIFGQSAGAGSVGFLLLSPLCDGLFQQAILQSGSALSPRYFRHDSEADRLEARKLAQLVGCPTTPSASMVACLRSADEKTLLEAQSTVYESGYFVRVDGTFLPDTPANLLARPSATGKRRRALMAGFNAQDGTFSILLRFPEYRASESGPAINRMTFDLMLSNTLLGSDRDARIRDAVYQEYVVERQARGSEPGGPDTDHLAAYVNFFTDYVWGSGSDATLRLYDKMGVASLYQYHFTHTPSSSYFRAGGVNPSWMGAGHSEELQFVFGSPFNRNLPQPEHELTDEEKLFSAEMMKMWSNFAKSGDPNRSTVDGPRDQGLPAWPRFTASDPWYLDLGLRCTVRQAVEARGMAFWNEYIPRLRKKIEEQRHEEL